jgi:hypothetical protein
MRSHLKKTLHKKGLVEWLKVKALSSNPSTAKKKKEFKTSLELYTEMLSQENKDAKKKSQINSRRL